jgi:protein TonB
VLITHQRSSTSTKKNAQSNKISPITIKKKREPVLASIQPVSSTRPSHRPTSQPKKKPALQKPTRNKKAKIAKKPKKVKQSKTLKRYKTKPEPIHQYEPIPQPVQTPQTAFIEHDKSVLSTVQPTAVINAAKQAISNDAQKATQAAYIQQLHHLLERHKHYPRLARRRGEQGTVKVSFSIQADGSLQNIQLHTKSNSSRLDNAALKTVRHLNGLLPPLPNSLGKREWPIQVPIVFS